MRNLSIALISCLTLVFVASSATAATIENRFKDSSPGFEFIPSIPGEWIQFEVIVTLDEGRNYDTVIWSLSGDGASAQPPGATLANGWAGVAQTVNNWEWHYTPAGGGKVDMGTNGRISPLPPAVPVGDRVAGGYGFAGLSKTGDGTPSLVGTVTIRTHVIGGFLGGAIQYEGVDGFLGSAGADDVTIIGGQYTVTPEPGTGLLTLLGLGGLGLLRRTRS